MKASDAAISYRPDVDGLRAVAVLAVIAFHLKMNRFNGGFVGVDIFFVISGFLISSIILKEVRAGTFSLARFYQRRILRIFPVLFAVMIFCSIAAWQVLFPTELQRFAYSLAAATLSLSNLYFAQDSGYFAAATSTLLMHTWSLAVEEQFYIFFPLLIVVLHRTVPKRLVPVILLLFTASLVVSSILVYHDLNATFYMPYTRAWELLLGTLLSLDLLPRLESSALRTALSAIGAALVGVAILHFSSTMTFPGAVALIPCGGAALLIYAGANSSGSSRPSIVTRVLAHRWIAGIGLISYSLYLWHWPLIVLHELGYISVRGGSRINDALLLGLIFPLSFFSWKYVERPFRKLRGHIPAVRLFTPTATALAVALLFASTLIHYNGFPARFPAHACQIAAHLDNRNEYRFTRLHTCFLDRDDTFSAFNRSSCLHLETSRPNWLLFGDSHAAVLWHALATTLPEVNLLQANVASCRPSSDVTQRKDADQTCREMTGYLFGSFLPSHRIDGLVITGNWYGSTPEAQVLEDMDSLAAWSRQNHVPILILGPSPEFDEDLPRLLALAIVRKDTGLPMRHFVPDQASLDSNLAALAQTRWHLPYLSLYQAACNSMDQCTLSTGGPADSPVWFDNNHFSDPGAAMVMSRLRQSGELLRLFEHSQTSKAVPFPFTFTYQVEETVACSAISQHPGGLLSYPRTACALHAATSEHGVKGTNLKPRDRSLSS